MDKTDTKSVSWTESDIASYKQITDTALLNIYSELGIGPTAYEAKEKALKELLLKGLDFDITDKIISMNGRGAALNFMEELYILFKKDGYYHYTLGDGKANVIEVKDMKVVWSSPNFYIYTIIPSKQ